jgi:hypothetical protein
VIFNAIMTGIRNGAYFCDKVDFSLNYLLKLMEKINVDEVPSSLKVEAGH